MRTLFLMLFLSISLAGWSQSRWNAEFRPTLAFPTVDVANADLQPGFGADLLIGYKLMPHLKAIGGWGAVTFSGNPDSGERTNVRETSFLAGLELRLPLGEKPLQYFVFAGGLLGKVSLENDTLMLDERTDYKLGGAFGAGVEYWLDDTWSIKPQLRFRSIKGDVNLNEQQTEVHLQYVALSVALSYSF